MEQGLIIALFILAFVGIIGGISLWTRKRRREVFAAICRSCNLQPLELDDNGKEQIKDLIGRSVVLNNPASVSVKFMAHNHANGDFACLYSYSHFHGYTQRGFNDTGLNRVSVQIGGFSTRGNTRRRRSQRREGVLLGRRLESPVLDSPVFFKAFANDFNRNLVAESLNNIEEDDGAVGWLKTQAKKMTLDALAQSLKGAHRVKAFTPPLNTMYIKANDNINENELVQATGEAYWQNFAEGKNLQAAEGWSFAILPDWVCANGQIDAATDENAPVIWNKLLLLS